MGPTKSCPLCAKCGERNHGVRTTFVVAVRGRGSRRTIRTDSPIRNAATVTAGSALHRQSFNPTREGRQRIARLPSIDPGTPIAFATTFFLMGVEALLRVTTLRLSGRNDLAQVLDPVAGPCDGGVDIRQCVLKRADVTPEGLGMRLQASRQVRDRRIRCIAVPGARRRTGSISFRVAHPACSSPVRRCRAQYACCYRDETTKRKRFPPLRLRSILPGSRQAAASARGAGWRKRSRSSAW